MNVVSVKKLLSSIAVSLVVSYSVYSMQQDLSPDKIFHDAGYRRSEMAADQHFSDEEKKSELEGYTPLHYAAFNGDVAWVQKLVQEDADVNATTELEVTPLHLAARCSFECPEIVDLLIKNGAAQDFSLGLFARPLEIAAQAGKLETFKLLARADAIDRRGIVRLVPGSQRREFSECIYTMQKGTFDLWQAIKGQDPIKAQKAIKEDGAILVCCDEAHNTFLHLVVGAYNSKKPTNLDKIAKLLVHALGRLICMMPNDLRQTPLHLAVMQGNTRLMRLFLRYGADANAQDKDGNAPSHYAADQKTRAFLAPENLFFISPHTDEYVIPAMVGLAQLWKDGQLAGEEKGKVNFTYKQLVSKFPILIGQFVKKSRKFLNL